MMRDHKPQIREGVFVLDWLARNLHEWPAVTPKIIPSGDDVFEHGANFYGDYVEIIGCIGFYTKDKWIRRRRELGLEVCEMNDLDWLARNVHEWPAGEHQPWCYVGHGYHDKITICSGSIIGLSTARSKITKDDWQARRAELQNKPSWKDAPEWATHLAQHSNGCWIFMLSAKVAASLNGWAANRIWSPAGEHGEVLGDWRDTLEKRPEQTIADICEGVTSENRHEEIFEPFVSVEDAATAKQPAPKGSGNPILGMVLADITNRALEGKEKYGEPLLAHNGRNPLWDAYQEALDLAMYLRQAIEEQK